MRYRFNYQVGQRQGFEFIYDKRPLLYVESQEKPLFIKLKKGFIEYLIKQLFTIIKNVESNNSIDATKHLHNFLQTENYYQFTNDLLKLLNLESLYKNLNIKPYDIDLVYEIFSSFDKNKFAHKETENSLKSAVFKIYINNSILSGFEKFRNIFTEECSQLTNNIFYDSMLESGIDVSYAKQLNLSIENDLIINTIKTLYLILDNQVLINQAAYKSILLDNFTKLNKILTVLVSEQKETLVNPDLLKQLSQIYDYTLANAIKTILSDKTINTFNDNKKVGHKAFESLVKEESLKAICNNEEFLETDNDKQLSINSDIQIEQYLLKYLTNEFEKYLEFDLEQNKKDLSIVNELYFISSFLKKIIEQNFEIKLLRQNKIFELFLENDIFFNWTKSLNLIIEDENFSTAKNIKNIFVKNDIDVKKSVTKELAKMFENEMFVNQIAVNIEKSTLVIILIELFKESDFNLSVFKEIIKNNEYILSLENVIIELEKNDKLLDLYKQFWFLKHSEPSDLLMLPYDYDGAEHPFPEGSELATDKIPVSIEIMVDFINILLMLQAKFRFALTGYTGIDAVKSFVRVVYKWINLATSKENESITEYERCYKWLRWEAEKVINLEGGEQYFGLQWVEILIQELVSYMRHHHFNFMPLYKNVENMDIMRNIFDDPEGDIPYIINKYKALQNMIIGG